MPFNVLLLPLLGGYIFISYWNVTRFYTKRYSGERLIFHAAIAGVALITAAFLATRLVGLSFPGLRTWWHNQVPFDYAGTSLVAFIIGAVGWYPLNIFSSGEKRARRVVEKWGDFLEVLLNRAMDQPAQVSLTLKNDKVYVGFVTRGVDPAFERKYIMLIPTLSGYRDQETKELVIANDYSAVFDRLIEGDPTFLDRAAAEFQLVIPISEIASANLFDPDVYEMFMDTRRNG